MNRMALVLLSFFLLLLMSINSSARDSIPTKLTQSLIDLKDKNPEIRRQAAEQLGRFANPLAVGPLVKRLKDKDLNVRRNAALALGSIGDSKAVKPLLKAIRKDKDLRSLGIRALGMIKDPQAITDLKEYLLSEDPLVVVEAALALGEYDDADVGDAFLRALNQTDEYGCQTIVNIFGKRRMREAVPSLLVLLEDRNRPSCGWAAADALGWIGDGHAIDGLRAVLGSPHSEKLQLNALRSLGRLQARQTYEEVIPFLNHSQGRFRAGAIEALVGMGNTSAVPLIRERLSDSDPQVREMATYALRQFGVKIE